LHLYLTHPQVRIDPAVPVPQWGLDDLGRARAEQFARHGNLDAVARIVASEETKAIETAEIVGRVRGLDVEVRPGLHENDRSATGYLPPQEFEALADAFFASPDTSVRGWETASAAQRRVLAAVSIALEEAPDQPTLFVGHGGVGTLLKRHCAGLPISREGDQPRGGGNHYGFELAPPTLCYDWTPMEAAPFFVGLRCIKAQAT
jgi:broad specificity phosphatase PhoE